MAVKFLILNFIQLIIIPIKQYDIIINIKIIKIKPPNPTGTRVPDLTINTFTGVGAILVPVIKFSRLKDIRVDPTKVIQVIDCVQR